MFYVQANRFVLNAAKDLNPREGALFLQVHGIGDHSIGGAKAATKSGASHDRRCDCKETGAAKALYERW